MPIRMVDDPGSGNDKQDFRPEGRKNRFPGGGGGGLINFIPLILGTLIKRPKLLILLLIIGAAVYFLGGRKLISSAVPSLSTGGMLDSNVYKQSEIYSPIADNATHPLPESVSLEKFCPQRGNQGSQGSCVAWASSYAARTILLARETGQNPNQVAFSPSYLYNQIALENCQGSYLQRAMEKMNGQGLVFLNDFPYTDQNCSRQPGQQLLRKASDYKIRGFNRLNSDNGAYETDLLAIKQNLAQGAPVVIGMMVGNSFMQNMMGKSIWIPEAEDYDMFNFGGHAMCVVGYDDNLKGGAFRLMNSWGEEWGEKGFAWVRYNDFGHFVKEAYGIYPMGSFHKTDISRLEIEFALRDNESKQNIQLQHEGNGSFSTRRNIAKGTRFKGEITNNAECYIYIFGEETDGSSYALFPYTPQHSPYCGITGTRIFPKYQSMMADETGTRDRISVLISSEPVNYKEINQQINAGKQGSITQRLKEIFRGKLATPAWEEKDGNIRINANLKDQKQLVFEVLIGKS